MASIPMTTEYHHAEGRDGKIQRSGTPTGSYLIEKIGSTTNSNHANSDNEPEMYLVLGEGEVEYEYGNHYMNFAFEF